MADSANNREFVELVLAVYDGEASDEQIDRLEALLKTDNAARSQFADLMLLQSQIGWSATYDSENCGGNEEARTNRRESARDVALDVNRGSSHRTRAGDTARCITKWAASRSLLAIAPIALLAIGLWWSQYEAHKLRRELVQRESADLQVARLEYANGCDWGNGPLRLHNVGSSIGSGDEITLYEGMAEFRLSNGARVSVEAPVSLMINSPSSLVLLYGKITALAPLTSSDFRITAGPGVFTASEAEFGVVHIGNKVEMHVFSGEVRATSPSMPYASEFSETTSGTIVTDDTGIFGRAIITADSAISLLDDDGIVKVNKSGFNAEPDMFATKLSMSGSLPATGRYVDVVRRSKPIGYWRFEKIEDGRVKNEINDSPELRVVGNLQLAGQTGDLAAEFRPGVDCYLVSDRSITGEGEQSDYSTEAWIKPSYVHVGGFVSLISDVPSSHATTLEIQGSPKWPGSGRRGALHPAAVRFTHHNLAISGREDSGTECYSKDRYLVRRWQHVVAVKEGRSMRLYLDGQRVAAARDKSPLSRRSFLAVGQDTFRHANVRNFVGQIDEVAFYDRALSDEEIVAHYQAPNWDAQLPSKTHGGI